MVATLLYSEITAQIFEIFELVLWEILNLYYL